MKSPSIIVIAVAAFIVGMLFGAIFGISGVESGVITLSVTDAVFLVLAVVSITLGIVSIVFSWVFYTNSQALNQNSRDILSDITQKISKIDEIVTKQYDKLLTKAIGAEAYEGAVPISDIQLLRKSSKLGKRRSSKLGKNSKS